VPHNKLKSMPFLNTFVNRKKNKTDGKLNTLLSKSTGESTNNKKNTLPRKMLRPMKKLHIKEKDIESSSLVAEIQTQKFEDT